MKKLTFLLIISAFTFTMPAYAGHDKGDHAAHAGSHDADRVKLSLSPGDARVSVNGLVCDFCARALEKVLGKEAAVKAIDVNLDTKIITINFKAGQSLSDVRITELITDSGYKVENIHRVE